MKPSKYRNVPTVIDGVRFGFKKEANRDAELRLLQRAGHITNLQRQVPFDLIVDGVKVGKYIADWTYTRRKPICFVVDDCKGVRTPLFNLKWKIMHAQYRKYVFVLS